MVSVKWLLKWMCVLLIQEKTINVYGDDSELTATEIILRINQAVDIEPSLLEGDIRLASYPDDRNASKLREKRAARRLRHYVWTSKIVPYEISSELVASGYQRNIQAAIQQFTEHTCIRWKPRGNESRWITFVKKRGCWSYVGMLYGRKGSQEISLGTGCNHKGIIIHEMMHAIGFWHEQSRYDRDQYVEIMWENIQPGYENNFKKSNLHEIDYLNEVYDTDSIMHYGRTSFSKNRLPTIQVIGDPNKPIGQRYNLSQTDVVQINALYDCSAPSGSWSSWTAFSPCDSQCKHKRQRFCASQDLTNCSGADTYGVETQSESCTDEKCYAPVDGHWGRWSAWSPCSASCDTGKQSRTRQCNEPTPMHGGQDCVGERQQVINCKNYSCALGPYDCDFDVGGMGIWTLCNETSRPRWYRHTGPTPSSGTGPPGDHTSGSGHYLYFEASSPARPQQTSCFFSQDFSGGSCQNLTFWFHMRGTGIGELKVLLRDSAGTNMSTVWQKSGQQGLNWIQASVEVQRDSAYKVYLVGVRGDDYRGDIAVDDIFFKQCEIDECQSNKSNNCEQVCVNVPGSFLCECRDGYKLNSDGKSCEELGKCQSNESNNCEQVCVNVPGSFLCECRDGYKLNSDGKSCEELDECQSNESNNCDQVCVNVPGSFLCECRDGYKLNSDGKSCEELDECQSNESNNCEQVCVNVPGSFLCECRDGYKLNSDGKSCEGLTNTQTAQPTRPPDNSEKWTWIVIGVIVGLVVVIILIVGIVVFCKKIKRRATVNPWSGNLP